MAEKEDFNRLIRRTAFVTIGLLAALIFGIIVLAGGDWLPGGVIVAATLVGLAEQVPVIRRLCGDRRAPSPPRSRPTG